MYSVDFSYAFSQPHRLTVCLPESSNKTLLDLTKDRLVMQWTYENLTNRPLASYMPPLAKWKAEIIPYVDGNMFTDSFYARKDGWLPILVNKYTHCNGSICLEAAGGSSAAIIRAAIKNTSDSVHEYCLECVLVGDDRSGYNPSRYDSSYDRDVLYPDYHEIADRILLCTVGADEIPASVRSILMVWKLNPGEERTGWIIRPYSAFKDDLSKLKALEWETELKAAEHTWTELLGQAVKLEIPDRNVKNAYLACLSDLFVMREPLADGYIGGICGTDMYRSCNPFESGMSGIALDYAGFHDKALDGIRIHMDTQGIDGNWNDPTGWTHDMWGGAGMKARLVMEHYRLTLDRPFLEEAYPKLLANSRWQHSMRLQTRIINDGTRTVTYGLMPKGVGDGGLRDDGKPYGVFVMHNVLSVYADRVAMETAGILDRADDIAELRSIYAAAYNDLLSALERGAVHEDGYSWIPAVPGKVSGSHWGSLYAFYPCELLGADHELIQGTIRHLDSRTSAGGQPLHTGAMENGSWVAITLDMLAMCHLAMGNGDKAVQYLYSVLNHGSPLYTWCEERGQEPDTTEIWGDIQHIWTPLAVVMYMRNAFVMESEGGLVLAGGISREWLYSGLPTGITCAPTHFGKISFQMQYDPGLMKISGRAVFPHQISAKKAVLHVRLPDGLKVLSVNKESHAGIFSSSEGILWDEPCGEYNFEITIV